jgi:hypothetical protein
MKGEGMSYEERIARGAEAARLLDGDILSEAIASAEEEVLARWLDSEKPDPDRALAAWATRRALRLVRDDLRRIVSDGQIAAEARRRNA